MAGKSSILFRPGYFSGYHVGKSSGGGSGHYVAPAPGNRDPLHLFRPGFFDAYAVKGAAGAGGGQGGSGGKKKATAKHVRYSRHPIRAAALHDAWAHRAMAGGQG